MRRPVRSSTALGALIVGLGLASSAAAQEPALILPGDPGGKAVVPPIMPRSETRLPHRRPLVATGFESPTRPIFLRGYAGFNYGQGPREAFIPTGFGTGVVQPIGTGFGIPAERRPGLFHRHAAGR